MRHRAMCRTSKPLQTWKMPSTAWMWLRKALPSPSPPAAPLHQYDATLSQSDLGLGLMQISGGSDEILTDNE